MTLPELIGSDMLTTVETERTFPQFLRLIRDMRGFPTWEDFAERIELSAATVHRVLADDPAAPSTRLNSRNPVARGLGYADWWGLVSAWERGETSTGMKITHPAPGGTVPHYNNVSAVRKDLRLSDGDGESNLSSGMKGDFTVTLDGQCMEPQYPDGSRVCCSIERWKAEGFVDGRDYWIRFEDGESTFKRVALDRTDRDILILTPLNGKPWKVHKREISLAARATGILLD